LEIHNLLKNKLNKVNDDSHYDLSSGFCWSLNLLLALYVMIGPHYFNCIVYGQNPVHFQQTINWVCPLL
jgi:hypothetical protein